jgi:hypothetical protein
MSNRWLGQNNSIISIGVNIIVMNPYKASFSIPILTIAILSLVKVYFSDTPQAQTADYKAFLSWKS